MQKRPGIRAVRHGGEIIHNTPEMVRILNSVSAETGDSKISSGIRFSPTAVMFMRRLLSGGGTVITDTALVLSDIDRIRLNQAGIDVKTFINDPAVVQIAENRRVTRAEVAVDRALEVPGMKLFVIGSAPAAIEQLIRRRMEGPMLNVAVLAAPSGFASVVQMKERLCDSDLTHIVLRGKKGGISVTAALLNAVVRELGETFVVA